jgi:hypothetical protein
MDKGEEVTKMDSKKIAGIVLLVVGVVVLILALTADMIGIGGFSGFGRSQIAGAVVGVIVAVAGLVLALRG